MKKNTKLGYKETLELESLPNEIEKLETIIKSLELELSDCNLYEKKGITTIAKEIEDTQKELENKLQRYFFLEEKNQALIKDN